MLPITVGFKGREMSMLGIPLHMCSHANPNIFSSPSSILFFSHLPMVWYVHFRTTKKVAVAKELISLIKNRIHNGCNIQCEYNNASSKRKKIKLLELAKVTLTPSHPLFVEGGLKKIFFNSW